MKFGTKTCFGQRTNAIANGADRDTFSTTLRVMSYFKKSLYEQTYNSIGRVVVDYNFIINFTCL